MTRAAYARLSGAGFPSIVDRRGNPPQVIDPKEELPLHLDTEGMDQLLGNEIIIQFLALSRYERDITCAQLLSPPFVPPLLHFPLPSHLSLIRLFLILPPFHYPIVTFIPSFLPTCPLAFRSSSDLPFLPLPFAFAPSIFSNLKSIH